MTLLRRSKLRQLRSAKKQLKGPRWVEAGDHGGDRCVGVGGLRDYEEVGFLLCVGVLVTVFSKAQELHVAPNSVYSFAYFSEENRSFFIFTFSKRYLLPVDTTFELLYEKFLKWVFKVTRSNELSDHVQKRL